MNTARRVLLMFGNIPSFIPPVFDDLQTEDDDDIIMEDGVTPIVAE